MKGKNMNQNSEDVSDSEPMDQLAEATAYLAKEGVAAKDFPPDKLGRLQVLLTSEPDGGCRVFPDPNWDPNECQEACDEYFQELVELKAFIKAFGKGATQ
jgi:hypothetical protein